MFVKKFLSTCKKTASIEQLRACRQKFDEPMRTYIKRWNIWDPKKGPNRGLGKD
jgi:hypothetical protein